MKKPSTLLATLFLGTTLWAMPSQITFQGTLKQQGAPVTGSESMQFSIVDSSGVTIPGTIPVSIANVQVTNGLFAVALPIDPTIPWEQYTPYIQVSVQGEILSPNQPLNANLYAVAAIPQGMIMLSTSTCPAGWARFAALDNTFPMGSATYGATGGASTYTLSAPSDTGTGYVFSSPQGSGSFQTDWGRADHTHTISPQSILPPFITMVFCQKQ